MHVVVRGRRLVFTGRTRQAEPAGIVFTHGPIFGFFARQGRHVARIEVKFGIAPPCQISP